MFKKVIEDFTCEHCDTFVEGDGYTNHCPKCLWSLHVDNEPGDRANNCNGLMEPFGILYTTNVILIVGFANLLADGFSMAVSDYLGTKSECEAKEGNVIECDPKHLWRSALYTFWSFALAGLVPLVPFLFSIPSGLALTAAAIATGVGLFVIGALRSHYTSKGIVVSGLEILIIGGVAAAIAYL